MTKSNSILSKINSEAENIYKPQVAQRIETASNIYDNNSISSKGNTYYKTAEYHIAEAFDPIKKFLEEANENMK